MSFDRSGFITTRFEARTEDVPVPELKDWFGDDEPVIKVRGLEGVDLSWVRDGAVQNPRIDALVKALAGKDADGLVGEIRDRFGLGSDVPNEAINIHRTLIRGLVEPECDMELARELYRRFPAAATQVYLVIQRLTSQGQEAEKKPPSSSGSNESDGHSSPSISEEDSSTSTAPTLSATGT